MTHPQPLRIGLAGLGTVGSAVAAQLVKQPAALQERAGCPLVLTAVAARDKAKDRGIDLSGVDWVDDTHALALRDDVDVVVELIGGENGPARDLVEAALQNGKHVVTANKALLAAHGTALAALAEGKGLWLGYEASVAGGVPIIKALREGLCSNRITAISGILNGTCNYILSTMRETGRAFADVLLEAQEQGYAEADPSFDVEGVDTAHKLAILIALAFGVKVDASAFPVAGITHIAPGDIAYARELGYRIKLLGTAQQQEKGGPVACAVEPCLVRTDSELGTVEDVYNAVAIEGDGVGRMILEGRGAGAGPTASAVLADIVDIARGRAGAPLPLYGVSYKNLDDFVAVPAEEVRSDYYLHLSVRDQAGVIAGVSAVLRDHDISIETMLQRGRDPGQPVSVIITTHACSRAAMVAAIEEIAALPIVLAPPRALRIA